MSDLELRRLLHNFQATGDPLDAVKFALACLRNMQLPPLPKAQNKYTGTGHNSLIYSISYSLIDKEDGRESILDLDYSKKDVFLLDGSIRPTGVYALPQQINELACLLLFLTQGEFNKNGVETLLIDYGFSKKSVEDFLERMEGFE